MLACFVMAYVANAQSERKKYFSASFQDSINRLYPRESMSKGTTPNKVSVSPSQGKTTELAKDSSLAQTKTDIEAPVSKEVKGENIGSLVTVKLSSKSTIRETSINMRNKGFVIVQELKEKSENKNTLTFNVYDTDLKQSFKKSIEIPFKYNSVGFVTNDENNKAYLIYIPTEKLSKVQNRNFIVVSLNIESKEVSYKIVPTNTIPYVKDIIWHKESIYLMCDQRTISKGMPCCTAGGDYLVPSSPMKNAMIRFSVKEGVAKDLKPLSENEEYSNFMKDNTSEKLFVAAITKTGSKNLYFHQIRLYNVQESGLQNLSEIKIDNPSADVVDLTVFKGINKQYFLAVNYSDIRSSNINFSKRLAVMPSQYNDGAIVYKINDKNAEKVTDISFARFSDDLSVKNGIDNEGKPVNLSVRKEMNDDELTFRLEDFTNLNDGNFLIKVSRSTVLTYKNNYPFPLKRSKRNGFLVVYNDPVNYKYVKMNKAGDVTWCFTGSYVSRREAQFVYPIGKSNDLILVDYTNGFKYGFIEYDIIPQNLKALSFQNDVAKDEELVNQSSAAMSQWYDDYFVGSCYNTVVKKENIEEFKKYHYKASIGSESARKKLDENLASYYFLFTKIKRTN
jgi:hypothetical protein